MTARPLITLGALAVAPASAGLGAIDKEHR